MNWHFIFFLLDIVGWITIAILLCNSAFITKANRANLNKISKLSIVIITICAGLFSVLINGIPDTGFSINSLMYAFFVSLSLVIYQRTKTKKEYLPKINKIYRKLHTYKTNKEGEYLWQQQ